MVLRFHGPGGRAARRPATRTTSSAMDISADVAVLEKMLEQDGLSSNGQGFPL